MDSTILILVQAVAILTLAPANIYLVSHILRLNREVRELWATYHNTYIHAMDDKSGWEGP